MSQTFSPQPKPIQNPPVFTNQVDPSRVQGNPQPQAPINFAPSFQQPQQFVTQPPEAFQSATHPPQVTTQLVSVVNRMEIPTRTESIVSRICGTAAVVPRPLVVGGQTIEKGSWPWLVAVYLNDAKGLSFKCGGNLVTSRTVITAAHCLKLRGSEHRARNVLIVAGRHNLLDWSESTSITFNAEKVLIHPDYHDSLSSFDGDVAMVIVKQTIR